MSKLFAEMVQEARESRVEVPGDDGAADIRTTGLIVEDAVVERTLPVIVNLMEADAGKDETTVVRSEEWAKSCAAHPAAIAEQEEENERAKLLMEGANLWPSAREQWMRLRYGCEPAMQDARPDPCRAQHGRIYFRDGKSLLLDSIVSVEPADADTNYDIHERVIIRHSQTRDMWGGPGLMIMVIDCADRAERDYLAGLVNKALQDRGSRPQLTAGVQSAELAALRVEQGKIMDALTQLLAIVGVEMPK